MINVGAVVPGVASAGTKGGWSLTLRLGGCALTLVGGVGLMGNLLGSLQLLACMMSTVAPV